VIPDAQNVPVKKPVEFGLLLHTRHLMRAEGGGAQGFEAVWEDAISAEAAGFDHIWVGDGTTVMEKVRGESLTIMASLAAKTKKIKIGVVPLFAALRHPVLLAHSLATLDVISQGRLIVCASVAPVAPYMERQFDGCGVPYHEKAGRLSESIKIMRRLWAEETLSFEGKYYRFEDMVILPKPVQRGGIPIWIAAGKHDRALRRAALLGDGWFSNAPTLEHFVGCRRKIDAYAAEAGRDGSALPSTLYCTFRLGADSDKAKEEGWAWMESFFGVPRAKLNRHFTLFGTPEECARSLQDYIAAGASGIVARLASDDLEGQARLLLEELKPRL
jgi:alkanesulfonate monooxygenase SsuD/methylene tetrahydromethanopterin reductase-like flavin-dependent oxidoreductase (luciferase family)